MNLSTLALAIILGAGAVGFSMHGLGGGVLYTPVQLLFGIEYHTAVLQSQWFTLLTAISAVLIFRKVGKVDWSLALVLESNSFAGAFLGGYFVKTIPAMPLTVLLAVLVLAAGIVMKINFQPPKQFGKKASWHWLRNIGDVQYHANLAAGLPLAFLIGICSGLTGAAGGFLKIPMLVRLFGAPLEVAFASSAFMVGITATGGLLGHLAQGEVSWHSPVLLSVFVLVGSQIGPRLTLRSKPADIKKRFAMYLFALAGLIFASLLYISIFNSV